MTTTILLISFSGMASSAQAENMRANASLMTELETVQRFAQQSMREVSSLTGALTNRPTEVGEKTIEVPPGMAGLKSGRHYEKQKKIGYGRPDDERPRTGIPDYIINLPEGKHIAIDSKTLFADYAKYAKAFRGRRRGGQGEAPGQARGRHQGDGKGLEQKALPGFERHRLAGLRADVHTGGASLHSLHDGRRGSLQGRLRQAAGDAHHTPAHPEDRRRDVAAGGPQGVGEGPGRNRAAARAGAAEGAGRPASSALAGIDETRKSLGAGAEALDDAGRRFGALQMDGGAAPGPPPES
jgi:hypothetical protein